MGFIDEEENRSLEDPELDEGWWASVLADEEAVTPGKQEINCKPCSTEILEDVDWDCVRAIFQKDEVVLLDVYGHNRGGLLVKTNGIQGFVPVSHLIDLPADADDELREKKLATYTGSSLYLKVIELDPSNERVVFSERAAQAGEGKRKELFESLIPGVIACGVITNITDFGAFVDLGGVEGLIHVSEISWGRVEKPSSLLKIGQRVRVVVLQANEATSRIALSIKRLQPNPWDKILENYKPGDIVPAEITSIMRFGLFARIEEGIEGLVHISSFPEGERDREISSIHYPGQKIQVKILHVDADRRRLGLGLIVDE